MRAILVLALFGALSQAVGAVGLKFDDSQVKKMRQELQKQMVKAPIFTDSEGNMWEAVLEHAKPISQRMSAQYMPQSHYVALGLEIEDKKRATYNAIIIGYYLPLPFTHQQPISCFVIVYGSIDGQLLRMVRGEDGALECGLLNGAKNVSFTPSLQDEAEFFSLLDWWFHRLNKPALSLN